MEKLHKWCLCRHPGLARWLRGVYALALIACMFAGGFAAGSLNAWTSAARSMELQREDYRQALDAVASAVGRAAGTAEQAAETAERAAGTAEGAALAAKGAVSKAGSAASKATTAAKHATTAVKKVEEALTPTPPAAAPVPEWLDTP